VVVDEGIAERQGGGSVCKRLVRAAVVIYRKHGVRNRNERADPEGYVSDQKGKIAMKKSFLTLTTLVLLAAFTTKSSAAVVMDAPSCSEWNPKEVTHQIWIEAYLSGIAMERNDNFLEKVRVESIVQWVSNYCRIHPKGEVAVAGVQLSMELMKRHRSVPR
jgi:hypothetical protein